MEAVVQASRCDFTIARPPRLVDARDESYRSEGEALPAGAVVMSFRAVAAFVLDCVEQRTHAREIVGLVKGGFLAENVAGLDAICAATPVVGYRAASSSRI